MTGGVTVTKKTSIPGYIKELLQSTKDPVHQRLLSAYKGDDPKASVEEELKQILDEVARED